MPSLEANEEFILSDSLDEECDLQDTFPPVVTSFEGNQIISEACNVSNLK